MLADMAGVDDLTNLEDARSNSSINFDCRRLAPFRQLDAALSTRFVDDVLWEILYGTNIS